MKQVAADKIQQEYAYLVCSNNKSVIADKQQNTPQKTGLQICTKTGNVKFIKIYILS